MHRILRTDKRCEPWFSPGNPWYTTYHIKTPTMPFIYRTALPSITSRTSFNPSPANATIFFSRSELPVSTSRVYVPCAVDTATATYPLSVDTRQTSYPSLRVDESCKTLTESDSSSSPPSARPSHSHSPCRWILVSVGHDPPTRPRWWVSVRCSLPGGRGSNRRMRDGIQACRPSDY